MPACAVLKMEDYKHIVQEYDKVPHPITKMVGAEPGAEPLRNLVSYQDEPVIDRDWMAVDQAAELLGISERAVRKSLDKGRYQARQVESNIGGGKNGMVWQIYADSLPEPARTNWYSRFPEAVPTPQQMAESLAHEFTGVGGLEQRLARAMWIDGLIKPALACKPYSKERAHVVSRICETTTQRWDGKAVKIAQNTVYSWIRKAENGGLVSLTRKARNDNGKKRILVSREWDKYYIDGKVMEPVFAEKIAADLWQYVASLWGNGVSGEKMATKLAEKKLVELTRLTLDIKSEAIPPHCGISLRQIRELRGQYRILALKDKDAKQFFDKHAPRVQRKWGDYWPNDVWIGDVTPIDIRMLREDGKREVYPRGIAWYDIATHRLMLVLFKAEPGEAVKRWQVAQAFIAAVMAWGLPKTLYLDNGSEYSWAQFIGAFNDLAQLGHTVSVHLGIPSHIAEAAEDNVVRATPYNAPAKPIEGAFSVLNKVLSMVDGYVGGDRTNKLKKKVGGKAHTFAGSFDDFHSTIAEAVTTYHKLPQKGQLLNKSPVEVFNQKVEAGWKAVGVSPQDLVLALAEEDTRVVRQGFIDFKPDGMPAYVRVSYYNHEFLDMSGQKVKVRALESEPLYIWAYHPRLAKWRVCPIWQQEDGLSDAGINKLVEAKRYQRRLISERRGEVYRLDLLEELASWNKTQPDFVETPMAAVIEAAEEIREMKAALVEHESAQKALPKPTGKIDRFGEVDEEYEFE
jgi:hypothetical protein